MVPFDVVLVFFCLIKGRRGRLTALVPLKAIDLLLSVALNKNATINRYFRFIKKSRPRRRRSERMHYSDQILRTSAGAYVHVFILTQGKERN